MADTKLTNSTNIEDKERVTFVDLGMALYERLTGRNATISYQFENMTVEVPRDTGSNSPRAIWKMDGTIRVTTSEPGQ